MKRIIRSFAVILLFLWILTGNSCKTSEDSAKEYERMEKKMIKEEEKSYKAAKKDFISIQSKATRQMMRESEKKAKKLNKSKAR
jgi:hypothetical protein